MPAPEWPDEPVIPSTPPDDPAETGTPGCRFDQTHWTCRLNVWGGGYLVADLGEQHGYTRTVRAFWAGPEGVTTEDGAPLLGFPAADDGTLGPLGPIPIPPRLAPRATSVLGMRMNLDSNTPVTVYDAADPSGTASFQTTMTVFDSLGQWHQLDFVFTCDAPAMWELHALVPAADLDGSSDLRPTVILSDELAFDGNGRLLEDWPVSTTTVTFFGANPQDLAVDLRGTSSWAGPSALFAADQDGFAAGDLDHIEVGWDGALTATYSSGRELRVGVLGIALFDAPSRLHQVSPHVWIETPASGPPRVDRPGVGGRGYLETWSLDAP
ncbi:MAG: flagellar hook-basal body complex protein [Myxococcota bacterium]